MSLFPTVTGAAGGVLNVDIDGLMFTVAPGASNYGEYEALIAEQATQATYQDNLTAFFAAASAEFGASFVAAVQTPTTGSLPNGLSSSQIYNSMKLLQGWTPPAPITNPWAGSHFGPNGNQTYADGWLADYNNNHQSIFGQIGSAIGGLVGGAVTGVGSDLGGQGNFVGQALDGVGSFAEQAGSTIGNDPVQAAADAAAAAPGLYLDYVTAGAFAAAAEVGVGVAAVGAATGNSQLGTQYFDAVTDAAVAPAQDPVASAEVLAGATGSILGVAPAAGLLAAGVGQLANDTINKIISDPNVTGQKATTTPSGTAPAPGSPVLAPLATRLKLFAEGRL